MNGVDWADDNGAVVRVRRVARAGGRPGPFARGDSALIVHRHGQTAQSSGLPVPHERLNIFTIPTLHD